MPFRMPSINDFFHRRENMSVLFPCFILLPIRLNSSTPLFLLEKALTHDPCFKQKYAIYSVKCFIQLYTWTAVCISWLNLNVKYLTLIILVSRKAVKLLLKSVGLWIKPCQAWYNIKMWLVNMERWCNSGLCFRFKESTDGIIRSHPWKTTLDLFHNFILLTFFQAYYNLWLFILFWVWLVSIKITQYVN